MIKLLKPVAPTESFGRLTRLERDKLARIRLMAIRRGVWFKVLNRLERGLMDLTIKVTRKIRSKILASAIYSVTKKLLEALESKVRRQMRQIGIPLAEKIIRIAQKWGNKTAHEWAKDVGFIQYLTIMKMKAYPYGV